MSLLDNKNILVRGGSGFIGLNMILELLKKTDYFFSSWVNKNIIIHESGAVRVD